jgi:hypothetical protein
MGEWMYRSTFLYLGTSLRWVVSFTPLPLYPREKSPRYALDIWVDFRVGLGDMNLKFFTYREANSDPFADQPVANCHTDCATATWTIERWGRWRKLLVDKLQNLYSSPNILTMIKSRRMRLLVIQHTWERRGTRTGFREKSRRKAKERSRNG